MRTKAKVALVAAFVGAFRLWPSATTLPLVELDTYLKPLSIQGVGLRFVVPHTLVFASILLLWLLLLLLLLLLLWFGAR